MIAFTTKQARDMSRMTRRRLPYTNYYLPSGGLNNRMTKGVEKQKLANYTISNLPLKSGKVSKTVVGNMRLN